MIESIRQKFFSRFREERVIAFIQRVNFIPAKMKYCPEFIQGVSDFICWHILTPVARLIFFLPRRSRTRSFGGICVRTNAKS